MRKNLLKVASFVSLGALYPILAFADDVPSGDLCPMGKGLGGVFTYITCVIQTALIPLIFAIAMVIFIWGVVQFVINSDDEGKKEKGRQFMLWGIIGLTVMVGFWSLVNILGRTFGLETTVIPQLPPPAVH